MEPLKAQTHYTNEEWPTSLKTAKEVADTLGISEERVVEFADAHFIPHWRVEGGAPLFNMKEAKQWAAKNILNRIIGKELPIQLKVMIEPPPAVDAPASIREITNLKQLPVAEYPPGVYFLVDGEEIVYIGQSVNPYSRVSQHKDKKFSRAYMIPIPSPMLDNVEGALIRAINPRYNTGDNPIARGPRGHWDDMKSLGTFAPGLELSESTVRPSL